MAKKIFIVKTEEMLDGEMNFHVRCHRKRENALFSFNHDIEAFKAWSKEMDCYEQEDIDNADNERTETSYFAKSSCDDYHFLIEIEESELFD